MNAQPPPPARRATAQQVALEHLAAELGTSVIPVREALKTLEAEGQVRYAPHRGYQVTRLSLDELTETYLIRRLLEDEIVRIAAPLIDAERYADLDRLMSTMEEANTSGDTSTMIAANRDFHFAIF